jgi:preprotein translocase subunit SecG
MQNVLLIIHLLLALCLIGVVLLQRSEGGGLGMGSSSVMTGRGAATALTKLTWLFAVAFIGTSITLTVLSARDSAGSSVMDRVGTTTPAAPAAPATPGLPSGGALLPPPVTTPATPAAPAPPTPAPTTPAPATTTPASPAPAVTPAAPEAVRTPAAPETPATPSTPAPTEAPAAPPRAQ